MRFTDDDLKRVKAELASCRKMEWPFPDAEALLARLEAAEGYIEIAEDDFYSREAQINQLKAWRKAAGKGDNKSDKGAKRD